MNKLDRLDNYTGQYLADYDFESVLVRMRQEQIVEILGRYPHSNVIEISCGNDLLVEKAAVSGLSADSWVIVEPSEDFARIAAGFHNENITTHIIRDFFEDSADKISAIGLPHADLIICSGLLHEIADPVVVLETCRQLSGPDTILHINVPNAYSFHRRLAREMGIVKDEKEMSERNQKLFQYSIFDIDSLIGLATENGYEVIDKGGYFIKPFTHGQMAQIRDVVSDEILTGLYRMGQSMPELASEIYINAKVRP